MSLTRRRTTGGSAARCSDFLSVSMHLRKIAAACIVALLLGGPLASRVWAQSCECQFPQSNENGHVAGVFGGGLFAGLVAAVLHIKHSREVSLTPRVDPFTSAPVPYDPLVTASAAGAIANSPAGAAGRGAPAAMVPAAASRRPRSGAEGRGPRLSADEAKQEGLVPPKTATLMPAFAMIGLGSLLLGLFLVRQRSSRRRRL